jgi:hypothetical protein
MILSGRYFSMIGLTFSSISFIPIFI